jgi:hypothetical protein
LVYGLTSHFQYGQDSAVVDQVLPHSRASALSLSDLNRKSVSGNSLVSVIIGNRCKASPSNVSALFSDVPPTNRQSCNFFFTRNKQAVFCDLGRAVAQSLK